MGGKHSKHDHNNLHNAPAVHTHKQETIPGTTSAEGVITTTATTTSSRVDPQIVTSTVPTTTIPANIVSSAENITTGTSTNFNLNPTSTTYTSDVIPAGTIANQGITHSTQGIPLGTEIESTATSINQPNVIETDKYYK